MYKGIVTLCLLIFSVTSLAAGGDFSILGKPINPACVQKINGSLTYAPYVTSFDVAGCQASLSHKFKVYNHGKGKYCIYKNNKNKDDGYYCYRVAGKSSNGIVVLHTVNSQGGSGVFDMLLLLQVKHIQRYDVPMRSVLHIGKGPFVVLIGYMPGGDRCSGGFQKVSVAASRLEVMQYPFKNSASQCEGAVHYSVDLGALQGIDVKVPL